ncbi:MAG: hypothetical protein ABEJ77_04670 [Halanaeroarchaeum sp.]
MDERRSRRAGIAAAVGGALLAAASIPAPWYGAPRLDAYVFHPPVGSPLWVRHEVVPILVVVGVALSFVGFVAVLVRDWADAGALRRWSGLLAAVGGGGLTLATPLLVYVSFGDRPTSTLSALGAIVVALVAAILFVPATIVLGIGYLRSERPRVGGALLGMVIGVPALAWILPGGLATVGPGLVAAIAGATLGRDLYRHHDPLPNRD